MANVGACLVVSTFDAGKVQSTMPLYFLSIRVLILVHTVA
jgi:hypothetical protein